LAWTELLPTLEIGLAGWRLRPWRDDDAPALAQHANNVNVWRWMSDRFPHPYTLEIAQQWVRGGHVEFGGDHWAIDFDGTAVGGGGIAPMDGPRRCVAEVGWWLAEPLWGRGAGSCVARALVARAFDDPAIARIEAPIHDGNARSMAVARRAGLQLEAVQRRSAVKDGRVIDRHLFVALRKD
jgi:RimJ/RimL family protein N-acetyltransferase